MKSILMGGKKLYKVYTAELLEQLKNDAGLDPAAVTKEALLTDPGLGHGVECIFSTWGMPSFTEEEIARCLPDLKAVFYAAGSVQKFARAFLNRGIKVISAWGANAVPVAEYTLAQILLANKGFFQSAAMSTSPEGRNSAKEYFSAMPGNYRCKVGIIGAGMLGKMVIRLLNQFDPEILVCDPFLPEATAKELGVKLVTLEELFAQCQTVSNHVANLPATVGMLKGKHFAAMPQGATFINTGRGAQVVEDELLAVLQERPDLTAQLDVTFPDPPVENSPFYTLPNVFLTPHIAGSSGNEVERMAVYMRDEFYRYKAGTPCEYEVSLKMLETMA